MKTGSGYCDDPKYNKPEVEVKFMGGALGPKSKLIMQNDGNLVIYDNNDQALWSVSGLVTPAATLFEEYQAEQACPCLNQCLIHLNGLIKEQQEKERELFAYKEDEKNPSDHIKTENYPVCSYFGPAPTPDGQGKWGTDQKDCWPELNSDGAYIGFDNKNKSGQI